MSTPLLLKVSVESSPDHGNAKDNGIGAACDTGSDTDGDGFTDAEEFACESDPTDDILTCVKSYPWLMLLIDEE